MYFYKNLNSTMRLKLILSSLLLIFLFNACRKDFVFQPSEGGLEFSKDTIYFDTVFTNIGSSTYTLKVYNRSNNDIKIPMIRFGKGINSKYRMTVDGMVGNNNRIFEGVELLANDSMFIFIETTVDIAEANPETFLYTDFIEFQNVKTETQKVELVTLIKDAYFLFPQRNQEGIYESIPIGEDQIYGFFLDENDPDNGNELIWTNEKPYVIYGYAAVPPNKTLQIQPGARIHCHFNSGIIAYNNSTIKALGSPSLNPENPLENEIIFEGNRLEPGFSDIPGQWNFIWLTQGSTNHEFEHVTIKNASLGLYVTGHTNYNNPNADVRLRNTQIYNCSNMGILSYTGYLSAENTVVNNAGLASVACAYGGKYSFNHCTISNTWPSSQQVALLISNFTEGFEPLQQDLVQANFHNCIVYGNNSISMFLDRDENAAFNFKFDHSLIRFNNINNQFTNNPLYQFSTDNERYVNCLIATNSTLNNPRFLDVNNNNFNINKATSAAVEMSNSLFSALVPFDLNQQSRPTPPASQADLGAYQAVEVEE